MPTKTFGFTGSEQTWTVPTFVSSIDVRVGSGAGGSPSWADWVDDGQADEGVPGKGRILEGTLSVTPGETLYLYVGGQGGAGNSSGAWPNGGDGNQNYFVAGGSNVDIRSGGGGGSSDIRQGGNAQSNIVALAGGGGGGGIVGSEFLGTNDEGGDGGIGGYNSSSGADGEDVSGADGGHVGGSGSFTGDTGASANDNGHDYAACGGGGAGGLNGGGGGGVAIKTGAGNSTGGAGGGGAYGDVGSLTNVTDGGSKDGSGFIEITYEVPNFKYADSGTFYEGPTYYYDGNSWVRAPVKYYDSGSGTWKEA